MKTELLYVPLILLDGGLVTLTAPTLIIIVVGILLLFYFFMKANNAYYKVRQTYELGRIIEGTIMSILQLKRDPDLPNRQSTEIKGSNNFMFAFLLVLVLLVSIYFVFYFKEQKLGDRKEPTLRERIGSYEESRVEDHPNFTPTYSHEKVQSKITRGSFIESKDTKTQEQSVGLSVPPIPETSINVANPVGVDQVETAMDLKIHEQTPLFTIQCLSGPNFEKAYENALAFSKHFPNTLVYVYTFKNDNKVFIGTYTTENEMRRALKNIRRILNKDAFPIAWNKIVPDYLTKVKHN